MKMRKLFAVVLALALGVSLIAGCGSAKEETKVTPQETAAASEAPAAAETAAPAAAESKSEAAPAETEAPAPAEEVTVESLLNGYFDSVDDIQSMEFNMLMDVNMLMKVFGQETEVKMNIDVVTEEYEDNAHMSGTMHMESYGEEQDSNLDQYIIKDGEKYVTYSYDKDTAQWSKFESDQPAITKEMIPKMDASLFKLDEAGSQYKVIGSVDLKTLIETMGKSFGEMFSGIADLDTMDVQGNADVVYFFNKDTKALEGVNIDMAKAFEEIFKAMFQAMIDSDLLVTEDSGEQEVDLSELLGVQIPAFTVVLDKIVINQGKEIVLPEEAKNAEETEDESDMFAPGEEENTAQALSVELAETFDFKDEYKTFTFKGQTYEANSILLSDFLAATGLELDEEDSGEATIAAGDTGYANAYLNDNYDYVSINLMNKTEEATDRMNCVLTGISVSTDDTSSFEFSVAGIKLGATLDEIIAVLGNPTYGYESEYFKTYNWEGENWDSISFTFGEGDASTGAGVSISNW